MTLYDLVQIKVIICMWCKEILKKSFQHFVPLGSERETISTTFHSSALLCAQCCIICLRDYTVQSAKTIKHKEILTFRRVIVNVIELCSDYQYFQTKPKFTVHWIFHMQSVASLHTVTEDLYDKILGKFSSHILFMVLFALLLDQHKLFVAISYVYFMFSQ